VDGSAAARHHWRASVLTGLYPDAHGVTGNSMMLPFEATTIAERLRPAGYAC
jgi:arylsulfatase A-like enzyme